MVVQLSLCNNKSSQNLVLITTQLFISCSYMDQNLDRSPAGVTPVAVFSQELTGCNVQHGLLSPGPFLKPLIDSVPSSDFLAA